MNEPRVAQFCDLFAEANELIEDVLELIGLLQAAFGDERPCFFPEGTIRFAVSALRVPGVDLKNIVFDDLRDVLTDISTDEITYAR